MWRRGRDSALRRLAIATGMLGPSTSGDGRLRAFPEGVLEDPCQPLLPLWHPAGIVIADRLLVVAEQVGNVCDGHALLEEDAGERVAQSMWCRRLLERACHGERL